MDAAVVWKEGLSFTGKGLESGFSIDLGSGQQPGGSGDGFRPMELLLVSLAGCTAMDVISILLKKRQQVASFEVKVHGDRAPEHPKVYTHIVVEYLVGGRGIDPKAVERAVELSESKYCSVMAMVRKAAPVETKISILNS